MKKKKYIKECLNFINKEILPIPLGLEITIKKAPLFRENPQVVGFYTWELNAIVLNPVLFDLDDKQIYSTIFHEIGHAVHFKYLDYRPQYLPRKHHGDRDYYCNTNQKESFAQCFADYCIARKKGKLSKIGKSKRLNKMDKIINELKIKDPIQKNNNL